MTEATIANFMAHMIEHPRPRVKTILDIFHGKPPLKKKRAARPQVHWARAASSFSPNGGEDEIRTHDPHVANVMLYQLSYFPVG